MKKKIKNSSPAEQKFGVILEDMNSKMDLLVDGHNNLDEKMDRMNGEFSGRIDSLHNEMNYKFDVVFDELRIIRNELKEKVGRDEFVLLEKRMAMVEKALATKK